MTRYHDPEDRQDPTAQDARARTDRWAFLRAHEERIATAAKEFGDNSQQHTAAVLDELLEYRADNAVYAPDADGGK